MTVNRAEVLRLLVQAIGDAGYKTGATRRALYKHVVIFG
jgi:hypothetical protein